MAPASATTSTITGMGGGQLALTVHETIDGVNGSVDVTVDRGAYLIYDTFTVSGAQPRGREACDASASLCALSHASAPAWHESVVRVGW